MSNATDRSRARLTVAGRYCIQVLVTLTTYLVAGKIGLASPFTSNNISPVWPASGVALAALLVFGYRIWPAICAAAFVVNWPAIPHLAAVGLACGNTLAALTGAFLLRRIAKVDFSLSRLRDVLGLIVFAGLASTMVSASIGVATLVATGVHPWSGTASAWLIYWLGDAMGIVLIAPLLLAFPALKASLRTRRVLELGSLLALLGIACVIIFGNQNVLPVKLHVMAFAVFPFVLWAAIRFGVAGCALSTLLIAVVAISETASGSGPFAQNTALMNAILLQAYLGVLSLSGLTLAADITERESLEKERAQLIREQVLREARLQLAAIVESSPDAILRKDLDGTITHWNQGAEQLYGYSAEEVIGKSAAVLMPPEQSDDFPEVMRRVRQGERMKEYETVRQRKDGSRVEVSLSMSPVFDSNGNVVGAAAIAHDISRRKKAEEALRKAEKLSATGRLAASIAHEINNPLESLSNLIYLLERNETLDSSARNYLDQAQQELRRASHVTKQMLAFHRHSLQPVPVSLSKLLDNILDLYDSEIKKGDLTVVRRFESDVTICVFSDEIQQVFANIVRNAIEAVPRHGTITMHVFASRRWDADKLRGIRTMIADTGPGIRPEDRERIFEPFFTTKGDNGTGLGLWITSGIVHKHGGSIRVRSSTRVGRSGTVFNIFLPSSASSVGVQNAGSAARAS